MIGFILAFFSILGWIAWTKSYYQVQEGFASIRSGWGGEKVFFKGNFWAYPVLHNVELMNISEHRLYLERTGSTSVICKDNIRVNMQLTFFIQVNANSWSVLKVAQTIGCEHATQKATLEQIFSAKFTEAIKTTAKQFDYQKLYNQQGEFKSQLLQVIGEELNGYQLNRISIVDISLLPAEEYDLNNILDAHGIINLKKMLGS